MEITSFHKIWLSCRQIFIKFFSFFRLVVCHQLFNNNKTFKGTAITLTQPTNQLTFFEKSYEVHLIEKQKLRYFQYAGVLMLLWFFYFPSSFAFISKFLTIRCLCCILWSTHMWHIFMEYFSLFFKNKSAAFHWYKNIFSSSSLEWNILYNQERVTYPKKFWKKYNFFFCY